ncbi:hypothetical protein JCM10020v2_001722 [Rhodotorula toruloides]
MALRSDGHPPRTSSRNPPLAGTNHERPFAGATAPRSPVVFRPPTSDPNRSPDWSKELDDLVDDAYPPWHELHAPERVDRARELEAQGERDMHKEMARARARHEHQMLLPGTESVIRRLRAGRAAQRPPAQPLQASSAAAPRRRTHGRRHSVGVQTDSDDEKKNRGRQESQQQRWDAGWDDAIDDAYKEEGGGESSDDDRTPRQSMVGRR